MDARRFAIASLGAAAFLLGTASITRAETVFLNDEEQRQIAPRINGQVIGAQPAQAQVWPVTFTFQTVDKSCTATAVGRWVILLAAHCVSGGMNVAAVSNQLFPNGRSELQCEQHPDYASQKDISADYALCLLSNPLNDPPVGFERISKHKETIEPGRRLLLLGYGCTTQAGDKDFGNLYEGYATADKSEFGANYFLTSGGAAVCTGDSGGGVYWIKDETQVRKTRSLVGISSRGDIKTHSWISSTSSGAFLDWASKWSKNVRSKTANAFITICGLDESEDFCRSE